MDAMADVRQAIQDVDVRALRLDPETLLLRPSWWPAPSPPPDQVERTFNVERTKVVLISGVFIYDSKGGVVDSALLIGDDTGESRGKGRDNGWAAMLLDSLIRDRAPNPESSTTVDQPSASEGTSPSVRRIDVKDPVALHAARLNNLGCAQVWLCAWGQAQRAFEDAKKTRPPQAPPSSSRPERSGFFRSRVAQIFGTTDPSQAESSVSETPDDVAAANLDLLPTMLSAYVDWLHARAEQQQRSWK
jgi:hypothetical protein